MSQNQFKPDCEKIKHISFSDLWALFQFLERETAVTMSGNDGIIAQNQRTVVWKELQSRKEFLLIK